MRPLENPGRVSGHERNLKAGMHVQKRGVPPFPAAAMRFCERKQKSPRLLPGLTRKLPEAYDGSLGIGDDRKASHLNLRDILQDFPPNSTALAADASRSLTVT